MGFTLYSDSPDGLFPNFRPVKPRPNQGKPRFLEWGKREVAPISISLRTERRAGDMARPEPESYQAIPQMDRGPVIINSQTVRVIEDMRRRQLQERKSQ